MNNLYWGATQTIAGATYLNTRSRITVEEGFRWGSTIEYVSVGNYQVESVNNNGARNQTLVVNAKSTINRLENISPIFNRTIDSGKILNNTFNSDYDFENNWYINGTGSFASGSTFVSITTSDGTESLVSYSNKEFDDFLWITKQYRGSTSGGYGYFIRATNTSSGELSGYFISSAAYTTNSYANITFQKVVNNSFDTLQTGVTSAVPSVGSYYWRAIRTRGNHFVVYESLDGYTYNKVIDYNDDTYSKGFLGYRVSADGTYHLNGSDVYEDKPQFTQEDIIKSISKMGGVVDVNVEQALDTNNSGFSPNWQFTSGLTYVYGSSNNIFFIGASNAGDSWNVAWYMGATFDNFVIDCEIRGASCTPEGHGIAVGNTNNWIGSYSAWRAKVAAMQLNMPGIARLTLGNFADPYNKPAQQVYNNYRLIKNGNDISGYLNGRLVSATSGVSIDSNSVRIGLYNSTGLPTGASVEYRNVKISKLNRIVDTIQLDASSTIDSAIQRVIPDGYAIVNGANQIDIFAVGSSRGAHNIGSSMLISSNESNEYNNAYSFTVYRGEQGIIKYINPNKTVRTQIDSAKFNYVEDINTKTDETTKNQIKSDILYTNKDLKFKTIETTIKPTIEQYDKINYVDPTLGSSETHIVMNHTKSYDIASGSFVHNLDIYPYGSTN